MLIIHPRPWYSTTSFINMQSVYAGRFALLFFFLYLVLVLLIVCVFFWHTNIFGLSLLFLFASIWFYFFRLRSACHLSLWRFIYSGLDICRNVCSRSERAEQLICSDVFHSGIYTCTASSLVEALYIFLMVEGFFGRRKHIEARTIQANTRSSRCFFFCSFSTSMNNNVCNRKQMLWFSDRITVNFCIYLTYNSQAK